MSKRHRLAYQTGTIKRIHVDKQMIARREPNPITVQTSAGSIKATGVNILGNSKVVYRPEDPLSCGARLWIETLAPLEITS